jgi:hypothetical protein
LITKVHIAFHNGTEYLFCSILWLPLLQKRPQARSRIFVRIRAG